MCQKPLGNHQACVPSPWQSLMVFLPGHIGAVQHNPILLLELVAVGQTGTHRSLTELGAVP